MTAKSYPPPSDSPAKGIWDKPKSRSWLVPFVVIACVAIVALAINLERPKPGKALQVLPPDVMGLWIPRDPRYSGRSLRLSPDELVLEVGPGQPAQRGTILHMRSWQEGLVEAVSIEYDAGEGPQTMELLLVGPDSMRLRNPREVLWTRAH